MPRKMLAILAVIAVTLAVVVVSIDARRSGNLGGSGSGSGGMIAPNGNYDPFSADCGNYNGNYDSLPGNYEISPLPSNYNGNYITYNGPLPIIAWVKSYDKGDRDSARGVATDSHDNVVVAGNAGMIKYDPTGKPFWITPYNGNSVAIDSHDNMIVTGGSGTIKYDSSGNQIWAISSGGNGVATDSKDNVIVVGGLNGDYFTIKYDSRGNQIWNRTYDSGGKDSARGVAIDADDNVIVTGSHKYSFTIKYDSDGNQLWVAKYQYYGSFGYSASRVAVDSQNNVIVTGTSWTPYGHRYHIVKYDLSGNVLWNRTYIDSDEHDGSFNFAQGVAVDSDDNVYVTGSSAISRNTEFSNHIYFTLKYDSNGNQLWKFTYDADTSAIRSFDSAHGVAVDSDDNVVVTGESNGDYFTIKLCGEEPQNDVPQHMDWDETTNSRRR